MIESKENNADNPNQETVLQTMNIPCVVDFSPRCVEETDACVGNLKNLEDVVGSKPSPKSVAYDGENVTARSSNGESYSGNQFTDVQEENGIENQHLSEACDKSASIGTQLIPNAAKSETEYASEKKAPPLGYVSSTLTTQESEVHIASKSLSALLQGPIPPNQSDYALESSATSIKCSVIKGSSLISTTTDMRQVLKARGLLTIHGESCVASSNATESIVLQRDWPTETMSDADLVLTMEPKTRDSTQMKTAQTEQLASNSQDNLSKPDKALRPDAVSFKRGVVSDKVEKSQRKKSGVGGGVVLSALTHIDVAHESAREGDPNRRRLSSTLGSAKNILSSQASERRMSNQETLETSRQLASSRVSAKVREDIKLAKIENQNKAQSQMVAQIVMERKTAELHTKTLERLSYRKDLERANKLRAMQLEEEQKVLDDMANIKSDERMQRMDQLRKNTLLRMKAAKVKQLEDEVLKEKIMVDRLRSLGQQTGRAASVPLQFNDFPQDGMHHQRKLKDAKLRESLSAGEDLNPRFQIAQMGNGKILPPIAPTNPGPIYIAENTGRERKSKKGSLSKIPGPSPLLSSGEYSVSRNGCTDKNRGSISGIASLGGQGKDKGRDGTGGRESPLRVHGSSFLHGTNTNTNTASDATHTGMAEDSLDEDVLGTFPVPVDRDMDVERGGDDHGNIRRKSAHHGLNLTVNTGSKEGCSKHQDVPSVIFDAENDVEDDRSNLSELSSEEPSPHGKSATLVGGVGVEDEGVGRRRRKQSTPWRALKPIALKPFIPLPPHNDS